MNKLISFSKLIRLPNLLIIALAQYAMRWGVIYPMYQSINQQLRALYPATITNPDIIYFQVSELRFFLLSLSTVMIAAAGYVINDYFDVKIDRINKPDQMVIDKGIKRRVAMGAHFVISLLAILIATFVSVKLGMWKYSFIYLACAAGLWLYSTEFKKQLLIGNIVVAVFVALVPFVVGLYELNLAADKFAPLKLPPYEVHFNVIFNFILGFSVLALLINFTREIIKDIEDMEGDKKFGCRTVPIALGIDTSKNLVSFLIITTMFVIGYVQSGELKTGPTLSFWYLLIFVQVPLAFTIYLVQKAILPADFRAPDKLTKAIMLTGLLYTLFIYHSFMPAH